MLNNQVAGTDFNAKSRHFSLIQHQLREGFGEPSLVRDRHDSNAYVRKPLVKIWMMKISGVYPGSEDPQV